MNDNITQEKIKFALAEGTIRQALFQAEGNKSRAASTLQIDYKTLLRKLKGYGIR